MIKKTSRFLFADYTHLRLKVQGLVFQWQKKVDSGAVEKRGWSPDVLREICPVFVFCPRAHIRIAAWVIHRGLRAGRTGRPANDYFYSRGAGRFIFSNKPLSVVYFDCRLLVVSLNRYLCRFLAVTKDSSYLAFIYQ